MHKNGKDTIPQSTKDLLIRYAEQYETARFLENDPSWFMHQVEGRKNQEAMAFIASCLSYGNRQQFMPKIQQILDWSGGQVDEWIRNGHYLEHFCRDNACCFYRLYSYGAMCRFFQAYQQLLVEHGTLGAYVSGRASDGRSAVEAICQYFSSHHISVIIPKDTQSACKRVCMFLRWMVRTDSPVDLGLWADFIDRRTLIIPLDTHVLQESVRLGLLDSKTTTMRTAQRLSTLLFHIFPDDPMKGDFALFGSGAK